MNRYWLFAGDRFYPIGGMEDFKDSYNSLKEAKEYINNMESLEWAHIYDMDNERIILEAVDKTQSPFECDYEWEDFE